MKTKVLFLLGLLLLANSYLLSSSGAEVEQRSTKQAGGVTLTEEEKDILLKVLNGDTSDTLKTSAEDICKKKCKVCFDGESCDLECARKSCF